MAPSDDVGGRFGLRRTRKQPGTDFYQHGLLILSVDEVHSAPLELDGVVARPIRLPHDSDVGPSLLVQIRTDQSRPTVELQCSADPDRWATTRELATRFVGVAWSLAEDQHSGT